MGSTVSCMQAASAGVEDDRVAGVQGFSLPDRDFKAPGASVEAGSRSCCGREGGGHQASETAMVADCQPSSCADPPLSAPPSDWQCGEASQHMYDQASAEAFASSRQALQAFARLAARSPKSQPAFQQRGRYRCAATLSQQYSAEGAMQSQQTQLQHTHSVQLLMPRCERSSAASTSTADLRRLDFGQDSARESAAAELPNPFLQQAAVSAFERLALSPADPARSSSSGCSKPALQRASSSRLATSPSPSSQSRSSADCSAALRPSVVPSQSLSSPFGGRPGMGFSQQQPQQQQQKEQTPQSSGATAPAEAPAAASSSCQSALRPPSLFGAGEHWQSRSMSAEPIPFGGAPFSSLTLSPFVGYSNSDLPNQHAAPSSLARPSWAGMPQERPNVQCCLPGVPAFEGIDIKKELNIEPLLALVCTVLQCHVAILSVMGCSEILVMRNGRLESQAETDASPLGKMWLRLPVPVDCEFVVVEDSDADSRMPPGSREKLGLGFFCAKPLCSAVERRLGTLCLGTAAPREFGPGPAGILTNLSELVVHEIEAAGERAWQRQQSEKVLAALDLYQDAFMLVDTTVPKWRILHLNLMAANEIGIPREQAKDAIFWDEFEVLNPVTGERAEPWVPCEAAAAKGQKFVLHKVSHATEDGPRLFTMRFRPACQEMQPNPHPCGLPIPQAGRPLYFVEVSGVDPAQMNSPYLSGLPPRSMYSRLPQVQTPRSVCTPAMQSALSQASFISECPMSPNTSVPFPGLELGVVLGRGAFGSVFQGTYNGEPVAVKIIVDNDQARVKDGLPVEAHITAGLNHTNVVRTIAHAWRPLSSHLNANMSVWDSAGSALGPAASSEGETWLLLELCDRGTLQDAITNGYLKHDPDTCEVSSSSVSSSTGSLFSSRAGRQSRSGRKMDAILRMALEVAEGMAYLHARGIVHGDLTGANVLLQSSTTSPYGLTAKVADFGLSREMLCKSKMETRTCGTITHMPPELLSSDVVSKAADVYAFGVLMWELFHGARAWEGLNHAQVIHAVAIMHSSLEFAPETPVPYKRLSQRCMSADPELRPTFHETVRALREMEAAEELP